MKKALIILVIIAGFSSQAFGGGVIRITDTATNKLRISDASANAIKIGFTPSDVPQADADALIDFYIATDGPGWTDNTGWLSDLVMEDWYGVTVSGGRVTQLYLALNTSTVDGVFDVSDFPSGSAYLNLYNTSSTITGAASDLPSGLTYLNLSNTSSTITGDVSDLPSGLTDLRLGNTSSTITGDMSDLPSGLTKLRLNNTSSAITGGTSQIQATSITDINISDTSMSQADVDDVLSRIYTDRSLFTDATPELNVGGTNAAPSGTYQYSASPSTGLEYAYALCNDDDAEGFNKWEVTWDGGSCSP